MFPTAESRETAFFDAVRHGERIVMTGALRDLLRIILRKICDLKSRLFAGTNAMSGFLHASTQYKAGSERRSR